MDRLTAYIEFARLMVERDRRLYQEIRMALEIKGLGNAFQQAKKRIAHARAAVASFEGTSGAFIADLEQVTKHIEDMHADLKFEAETLGNAPPEEVGEKSSKASSVSAQPSEHASLATVRALR